MITNNKFLTYILISIIAHGLIIFLVAELSPQFYHAKPVEPKEPVLQSYLIVAKPKPKPVDKEQQVEAQPINTDEIAVTESHVEAEEANNKQEAEALEQTTQVADKTEPVNNAPLNKSSPSDKSAPLNQSAPLNKSMPSNKATPSNKSAPSPYAAAQNYLNSLEQNSLNDLSQQALSDFRTVKPLTNSRGTRSAEQYNKQRSEAFAAKGSGIELVAELSHNSTLVRVYGSCVQISQNERGDQVWMASNACGPYDPFKGQLQKSLDKYLKK